MDQNFDWVTKAKRNTVLFRKIYDPVLGKECYVKLNPKQLLREVDPRIRFLGKGSILSIPDIYDKLVSGTEVFYDVDELNANVWIDGIKHKRQSIYWKKP